VIAPLGHRVSSTLRRPVRSQARSRLDCRGRRAPSEARQRGRMRVALTGATGYTAAAYSVRCAARRRGHDPGACRSLTPAVERWRRASCAVTSRMTPRSTPSSKGRGGRSHRRRVPHRRPPRFVLPRGQPRRTARLLDAAAGAGVRRFVHTSTVGVHATCATRRPTRARRSRRATSIRRRRPRPRPWRSGSTRSAGYRWRSSARGDLWSGRDAPAQALSPHRARLYALVGMGRPRITSSTSTIWSTASCSPWIATRPSARPSSSPAALRLAGRAGGAHRPADGRTLAAFHVPVTPLRWRARSVKPSASARHRATDPPSASRVLDQEPRLFDREGAQASGLRAQGRSRGGHRAHRRLVSRGRLAMSVARARRS